MKSLMLELDCVGLFFLGGAMRIRLLGLETDAGSGFVGAVFEDAVDSIMLGGGDPEVVFILDGDLTGDVLAAELFVGGEPGGGVAVGFLGVGLCVDGEEV